MLLKKTSCKKLKSYGIWNGEFGGFFRFVFFLFPALYPDKLPLSRVSSFHHFSFALLFFFMLLFVFDLLSELLQTNLSGPMPINVQINFNYVLELVNVKSFVIVVPERSLLQILASE